jgi:surfeit locus 1 family protein
LCFFIIFCLLSYWQFNRYEYKKSLLAEQHSRLLSSPKPFLTVANLADSQLQFQTVKVQGYYLNHLNILMQNEYYHDQLGYEVLTPLKIKGNDKLLLIDRGWVKAINNLTPPKIANISGQQQIAGYIKTLNENKFTLGKNILNPDVYPLVIQKISFAELSQITKQSFYPYILRLNASAPNGFIRDWIISTMSPARHLGYAIQWLLMALALLIAYFCFSSQQVKNDDK